MLEGKDIVKLDSAICCHSMREPFQVILQSARQGVLSLNLRPLQIAFGRWCLRRSVPIKRLVVCPCDVVSLLSDAKVMQNVTNAKEVVFMITNYQVDAPWPAEIGLLFNAMSDKQTLTLYMACYQQVDVISMFLEHNSLTNKHCVVEKVQDIGLFMEDERIVPFLFRIGELYDFIRTRTPLQTEVSLPLNSTVVFLQLEELYVSWLSSGPWLPWVLSRSPNLKTLAVKNIDDYDIVSKLSLCDLTVHGVTEGSKAAGLHAFASIPGSQLCNTLEDLTLDYYMIVSTFDARSLAALKKLKRFVVRNFYFKDEDLLFVLRQLTELNEFVLHRGIYAQSLGHYHSPFYYTLFSKFDFKNRLIVTIDLHPDCIHDQSLTTTESFPSTCVKSSHTEDLSIGFPLDYYSHSQLRTLARSFMMMLASGRFANLRTLYLSEMLLSLDEHFMFIRDGCPRLTGLLWLNDGSNSHGINLVIDSFPQGWKNLGYVQVTGVKISAVGLREMSSCSQRMKSIYVKAGLQLKSSETMESVVEAMKRDFPRVDYISA